MPVHVVLGAGGPTGLECVKRLLSSTESEVRAVVRDPAKYEAKFPQHERLSIVKGDVTDKESIREALKGSSGVIFAASATSYTAPPKVDFKGVANVADVAKEEGVQRVVLVSSMLVSPHNKWVPFRMMLNNIRYGLMDNKFKGEEYLRNSGVEYTIVRPGGLTNGPAGESKIIPAQGDKAVLSTRIHRSDVAAVSVEALTNPAAANITLEIGAKGPLDQPFAENLRTLFDGLTKG